jgi:hypothetical protein
MDWETFMLTIKEYRFIYDKKEYMLKISFDDESLMNDQAEFKFTAATRSARASAIAPAMASRAFFITFPPDRV